MLEHKTFIPSDLDANLLVTNLDVDVEQLWCARASNDRKSGRTNLVSNLNSDSKLTIYLPGVNDNIVPHFWGWIKPNFRINADLSGSRLPRSNYNSVNGIAHSRNYFSCQLSNRTEELVDLSPFSCGEIDPRF